MCGVLGLSMPKKLLTEVDHFKVKEESRSIQVEGRTGSLMNLMKTSMLPVGYPHSVPKEYTHYQVLNSFQASCSYVREFLGLSRLLQGLGVGIGSTGVAPTTAAMNWLLRDGVGMVGGLFFASRFGSRINQNVKSWRLFADLINNVGLTLEIIAPAYPGMFIPLICAAALCRSMCGISAGAANAVISSHWGERNSNIADVQAKNGNQATVVNLSCLALALVFGRFSKGGMEAMKTSTLAVVFSLLTLAHTVANIKLMSVLALRSLNISRLIVLARSSITRKEGMDLRSVARAEPVLRLLLPSIGSTNCRENGIHYYCPVSTIEGKKVPRDVLEAALTEYAEEPYFVVSHEGAVFCCFSGHETALDRSRALFDCVVRRNLGNNGDLVQVEGISLKVKVDSMFPAFWKGLAEAGWDTDELSLQLLPPGAKCFRRHI